MRAVSKAGVDENSCSSSSSLSSYSKYKISAYLPPSALYRLLTPKLVTHRLCVLPLTAITYTPWSTLFSGAGLGGGPVFEGFPWAYSPSHTLPGPPEYVK